MLWEIAYIVEAKLLKKVKGGSVTIELVVLFYGKIMHFFNYIGKQLKPHIVDQLLRDGTAKYQLSFENGGER